MHEKENYFGVEDKRKWNYTRVYNIVLEDKELDAYEKLTYVMLSKYADNSTGQCFPSRRTLYELVGCSDRKLDKCIKRLIEKGYIKKKNRKNGKQYKTNVYLVRDIEDIKKEIEGKNQGGGECGSLGGECGSQRTNLLNYTNKTEEEEQLSTGTLSTTIKNKYQRIYNRTLSPEFEKEILSIFDDENIINYCLSLSEKNSDKPSYLITVLQDWEKQGLTDIESIKQYQLQRKEENKKKYKRYNTDTEIEVDSNSIKQVKLALKHKTGLDFTDRHIKEVLITDTRNGQKLQDFSTVINAIGKLSNRELSNAVTKDKIIQAISIKVKEINCADRSYNKGYR